tara:strand:- start:2974 stop:3495 length:522 start_codon:yes stop_codon:yes gene_type:complete
MESNDLKNVLKEEKSDKIEKGSEILRVHKKPMQLRDIETRSSNTNRDHKIETPENMNKYLNEEKDQIFKQAWNRLDTGMKLNRIRVFTEEKSKEKKLTKENQEELRKILFDACRSNKLNKVSEINYDKDECKIISIKNLEIKENGKSTFTTAEVKKTKKSAKTKTNIDRLLKK